MESFFVGHKLVKSVFEVTRPKMKGVDWGSLYKTYKEDDLDPKVIEDEIVKLIPG